MKVLIDISKIHPYALKRGVGSYALNLFKSLKELPKDKNEYFLQRTKQDYQQIDIIHLPFFDPFFLTLPIIRNRPTIITIHDLIPLKFPKYYPVGIKGQIKKYIQRLLVNRVQAIITDSVVSKEDIMKIMNYPQEKIYSIYLAADKEFHQLTNTDYLLQVKKKYQLPNTFLLYVGDLNWNKNLKALVKAFKILKINNKKNINEMGLVFIGEAFVKPDLQEAKDIKALIKKLNLENDILTLGFVPIRDLVAIYNLAVLYIQPSFYEGFGLPVLEAMSCGCPVLSSNQGSLPEVGGQAVEYFNPYIKNDLEAKLISFLLNNSQKINSLQKIGLIRANKFSWLKTAAETQKVYEKVLSEN